MAEIMGRRCKVSNKNDFKSSSLIDRASIEKKTIVKDGWGQPIDTWALHANVSINMLFQNGKAFNAESVIADKEVALTSASGRINWRLDITTEMRLKFRGDIYDIKAVLPDSQHRFVDLAVTRGANKG